MTRPHLTFKHEDFETHALVATEKLFEAKPWRLDLGQLDLYQRWADDVCEAYGVPSVGIQKVDYDVVGFGYIIDPETGAPNIIIGRYSLATLFCAMGAHLKLSISHHIDHLAWGFSLFYVMRPVMFRRRVREGRIEGLTARDTFSRDTWARLVAMRLAEGNDLIDPHFDIRTLDAEDDLVNPDEVYEANDFNSFMQEMFGDDS